MHGELPNGKYGQTALPATSKKTALMTDDSIFCQEVECESKSQEYCKRMLPLSSYSITITANKTYSQTPTLYSHAWSNETVCLWCIFFHFGPVYATLITGAWAQQTS